MVPEPLGSQGCTKAGGRGRITWGEAEKVLGKCCAERRAHADCGGYLGCGG